MFGLSDYVVLSTQKCRQIREFQGHFFHGSDCFSVRPMYVSNWKWFLQVASRLLRKEEVLSNAEIHIDATSQTAMLVGICLRFLDRTYRQQFENAPSMDVTPGGLLVLDEQV